MPTPAWAVAFVAKSLAQSSLGIMPQVLAEGRSIRVQLAFQESELNQVCLHVDPAGTLDAKRNLVDTALGTRLASRNTVSRVMGDLNAIFSGDFRLNLALNSRDQSDDPLGTHIHLQHGAFKALHYDVFCPKGGCSMERSQKSPGFCRRI
jgi:hypothetical protein